MSFIPKIGRGGQWEPHTIFRWYDLDEDGSGNIFETDQAKTTKPTHGINTVQVPDKMQSGIIHRIHYRLNPANAVTYTLRIWDDDLDGTSVPYEQNLHLLYESPSGQADDEDYDRGELWIPFRLVYPTEMFYSIDWSGASGNCSGFIEVSGEKIS